MKYKEAKELFGIDPTDVIYEEAADFESMEDANVGYVDDNWIYYNRVFRHKFTNKLYQFYYCENEHSGGEFLEVHEVVQRQVTRLEYVKV